MKRYAMYARFAKRSPAWIFVRHNNPHGGANAETEMEHFSEKCKATGLYEIIGSSTIHGDGKAVLKAIQEIVRENPEITYVLSPKTQDISREPLEVLKAIRYLKGHGIYFLSADDGELADPTDRLKQYEKASASFSDDPQESLDDCQPESREQSALIL